MTQITLRGSPINTNGDMPKVGAKAPDFHLTAADLSDVTLATYKGKKKLLNIVPSLDTPTCALSTKKFNEQAAKHPNTVMLIISADLPFAMKRFCANGRSAETISITALPYLAACSLNFLVESAQVGVSNDGTMLSSFFLPL